MEFTGRVTYCAKELDENAGSNKDLKKTVKSDGNLPG